MEKPSPHSLCSGRKHGPNANEERISARSHAQGVRRKDNVASSRGIWSQPAAVPRNPSPNFKLVEGQLKKFAEDAKFTMADPSKAIQNWTRLVLAWKTSKKYTDCRLGWEIKTNRKGSEPTDCSCPEKRASVISPGVPLSLREALSSLPRPVTLQRQRESGPGKRNKSKRDQIFPRMFFLSKVKAESVSEDEHIAAFTLAESPCSAKEKAN